MNHDNIINIAIQRSVKELNYVNKSIRYSDFINLHLRNIKYTSENFEEYMNFLKDIQNNIKDLI